MRKISSDVLFTGAIQLGIRLRGIVFIPFITISLGVAAFGAYSLILAVTTFLELVFGFGLYAALVKYGQVREDIADLYYSLAIIVLCSTACVASVLIVFAEPLSTLTLGSTDYASAYAVGSLLIVSRALIRLAKNYYRMKSRIKIFSIIDGTCAYAILFAVVTTLFLFDGEVVDVFVAIFLVEMSVVAVANAHIISEIGIKVPRFTKLTKYLRYSLPLAASSFANNAAARVDRVLIGFFLGAEAVGLYSVVYQLSIVLDVYNYPIRTALFPEFSSLLEEGKENVCASYTAAGVRYYVIIGLPTIGGIGLIGSDMYQLMTQSDPAGLSGPLLVVIPAGIFLLGIDRIHTVILNAAERTLTQSIIHWIAALSNLALNVVLIPTVGVLGAGIATALTYGLSAGLIWRKANESVPLTIPWDTILRSSIAVAGMIVIATMVLPNRLPVIVLGSIVTYFLLLFSTGELTFQELKSELAY